jgi:hypothetical protein
MIGAWLVRPGASPPSEQGHDLRRTTSRRTAASKYVPRAGQDRPPAPQWKRIDAVQDTLPDQDRDVAEQLGGTITPEAYAALLKRNEA